MGCRHREEAGLLPRLQGRSWLSFVGLGDCPRSHLVRGDALNHALQKLVPIGTNGN